MRKLTILLCTALLAASCVKTIDKVLPRGDMSLLELKIQGQLGTAVIDRDEDECSATVYVMARADFPYAAVPVEGIVVSAGATASVTRGSTLNFSNPERKAKITVTSESGNSLDWFIYLETYDAFYVGEWKILECKLACNQRVSGSGDGAWTTQLSGSEFGTTGLAEYDDRIIITMNPEMQDNMLTGTLEHTAGADGEYGHFWGVYPPYSVEEPLDMDPRLRHLLHPGKSDSRPHHRTDAPDPEQHHLHYDIRHRRRQRHLPLHPSGRRQGTLAERLLRQYVEELDGIVLRCI